MIRKYFDAIKVRSTVCFLQSAPPIIFSIPYYVCNIVAMLLNDRRTWWIFYASMLPASNQNINWSFKHFKQIFMEAFLLCILFCLQTRISSSCNTWFVAICQMKVFLVFQCMWIEEKKKRIVFLFIKFSKILWKFYLQDFICWVCLHAYCTSTTAIGYIFFILLLLNLVALRFLWTYICLVCSLEIYAYVASKHQQ